MTVGQVITAKLKLTLTPEQHAALRTTQLAYRAGLNAVSQYAFAHGKTGNARKLHDGMYGVLRATHDLPAQLAEAACRQVAATYQGLWTRTRQNTAHRKARLTKNATGGWIARPTTPRPR
jgi:putative transposase